MAINGNLPNDNEVMQVGLYETDANAVRTFVQRVAKFNQRYTSNVLVDVEPHEKGDAAVAGPHFKIRLTFPNHEVQDAFWME